MAAVMGTESAIVRTQFVSGTHAIATALFACLRPGDELLAVAGRCVPCPLLKLVTKQLQGSCCLPLPCTDVEIPELWSTGRARPSTYVKTDHSAYRLLALHGLGTPSISHCLLSFAKRVWLRVRPYDTLEEVIGLRGQPGIGSLRDWGVTYREVALQADGRIDLNALSSAVTAQGSCPDLVV